MKTLEDLLNGLDRSREELLVTLELLPDEAFSVPNAIGHWSIQDLLANITAWEAELVTGLMRLKQRRKPDKLLAALSNRDAFDQQRLRENRGRPLDTIFDDFQKVRMELETWLEDFSDRELFRQRQFKWLRRQSLGEIVGSITIQRERPFAVKLTAFAEAWQAAQADNVIPLLSVEANDE